MQKKLRKYAHAGFTLPEMILAVIVLAIIVTIAFPDIANMMRLNRIRMEEERITEIRRALEAYNKETGTLPEEGDTWYEDLRPYTRLSARELERDVWESPHVYRRLVETQTFRDATRDFHYAFVMSAGEDTCFNNTAGNCLGANARSSVTGFKSSAPKLNDIAAYETIEPYGDDQLVKFTDFQEKVENIERDREKVRVINNALTAYAQNMFNQYIVAKEGHCVSRVSAGTFSDILECFDGSSLETGVRATGHFPNENQREGNLIYYPPSGDESGNLELYGSQAGPLTSRGSAAFLPNLQTVSSITVNSYSAFPGGQASSGNVVTNSNSSVKNNRGVAMVRLMRILGLPDEYCCSAEGEPFYYYSNPRRRTATGACAGSKPTINETKLPARVMQDPEC